MTLREHLDSYEKQTGLPHPTLLDAPELPPGCTALWRDFIDLHKHRGRGGMGDERITPRNILDWQEVHGIRLAAWEIDAIEKADDAFFEAQPE